MPTVSVFYGITIRVYVHDHPPPHFHAIYGEDVALVAIATGEVIEGHLPRTAARLVRERAELHCEELDENWRRREQDEAPFKIEGLDAGKG